MEIEQARVPIQPAVRSACEMLGFDPLYVANEGKLVAMVKASDSGRILAAMRATRYAAEAAVIGQVVRTGEPQVRMHTAIGGTRLIDMLSGEMLPRIC